LGIASWIVFVKDADMECIAEREVVHMEVARLAMLWLFLKMQVLLM
jgi:hypothetical protein